MLENVEGFVDMQFLGYKGLTGIEYPDGSVTPAILRSELNEIGYDTLEPKILNASDYGVPQRRNRIIFIGYRRGLPAPSYPEPTTTPDKYVSLKDAIGDLIEDQELREQVNPTYSSYQKSSRAGRTPDIYGNPISVEEPANTEMSKLTDVVRERFDLFREGEPGT